MLVILFISVFFLSTLTFVSNQFLSIYHIHSLDHIFTYTSFGHLTAGRALGAGALGARALGARALNWRVRRRVARVLGALHGGAGRAA